MQLDRIEMTSHLGSTNIFIGFIEQTLKDQFVRFVFLLLRLRLGHYIKYLTR